MVWKIKSLFFILFPILVSAQIRIAPPTMDWKYEAKVIRNPNATIYVSDDLGLLRKRTIWVAGLSFASGVFYGIHETVVHKPNRIPDNWNKDWWDSRISWKNKYYQNDPNKGPAYPGSTTFLVIPTDAKHTFGALYRGSIFITGGCITFGDRRPVKHYIGQILVSAVSFGIGFALIDKTPILFK